MKKKIIVLTCVIFTLLIMLLTTVKVAAFNFQIFDTKWNFSYAEIGLPDGTVIKGNVDSWRDYEDSDVVQVTINEVTYLTHYSNVILTDKKI